VSVGRSKSGVNVTDSATRDAAARLDAAWGAHSAGVLAYAARRTSSVEDAADALAETFLVAWRRLGDVPAEPDTRPWLFGVARLVIANQHRAERRRHSLTAALIHETAMLTAVHMRPPRDDSRSAQLWAALARLTEADREVLLLAGWEALTPTQIAVVLGCSPATARVRLHRARRRLSAQLDAEHFPLDPSGDSSKPRPATTPLSTNEVPR
jgi:RNA polymerase sigma factor (sigma-70 family)